MSQLHLDTDDEGKVNPLFCRRTTCLADDGAEITLRQTHLVGIETNLVLLDGMSRALMGSLWHYLPGTVGTRLSLVDITGTVLLIVRTDHLQLQ